MSMWITVASGKYASSLPRARKSYGIIPPLTKRAIDYIISIYIRFEYKDDKHIANCFLPGKQHNWGSVRHPFNCCNGGVDCRQPPLDGVPVVSTSLHYYLLPVQRGKIRSSGCHPTSSKLAKKEVIESYGYD